MFHHAGVRQLPATFPVTPPYHLAVSPRARRPAVRIEPLHVADFVHPDGSPLAGRPGIVMAYAVVHPDGGCSSTRASASATRRSRRPIGRPSATSRRCSEPRDLARRREPLANSHLHFDHCGQNGAFPGRPIHVQAVEHAAAQGPDYTITDWVDAPGTRYELVDGDLELLSGVRLVPTPGHTPGHQSMLIEAAEGRTAIVGQAVYTRAEWSGDDGPAVSGWESAWDRASYRRSVERIRAFRPDVVLFGHDR